MRQRDPSVFLTRCFRAGLRLRKLQNQNAVGRNSRPLLVPLDQPNGDILGFIAALRDVRSNACSGRWRQTPDASRARAPA